MPYNQYTLISLGKFGLGYKGISCEYLKYFRNGQFSVSTRFDYTTAASSWNSENRLHYIMTTAYRFPHIDFKIDASVGHFLFNDETWRVQIVRSFGELDLGFMGIWNHTIGLLTGLVLNIPFPVTRHAAPREIRLKPPNYIHWKYRYLPLNDGYILETDNEIDLFMKRMIPSYIYNNLHQLKN